VWSYCWILLEKPFFCISQGIAASFWKWGGHWAYWYFLVSSFFRIRVPEIITRRLAIANRSRVSIRGRPCEICLASSLIAMHNLVVVSHIVCTHVRGRKNFWDAGPHPLKRECSWRRNNTLLSCIRYHTKFRRSMVKPFWRK